MSEQDKSKSAKRGSDQNFDSHSRTFKNNIYGSSKGKVREAVLMRDLDEYLADKPHLNILDIGGGQGQIALQLAALGHTVTIADISKEMLELAQQHAQEQGLNTLSYIHQPLQNLPNVLNEQYDLVLCHAVFEWLEQPHQAFAILSEFCKPRGGISLMYYNAVGQMYSNLCYGNFDYIDAGFKAKKVVKLNPQSALEPDDVMRWADELGLKQSILSGVRCFHDNMRDISHWQTKLESIIEKELEYSRKPPYLYMARYIHTLFVKE